MKTHVFLAVFFVVLASVTTSAEMIMVGVDGIGENPVEGSKKVMRRLLKGGKGGKGGSGKKGSTKRSKGGGGGGGGGGKNGGGNRNLVLGVRNPTRGQPFGQVFAVVHNSNAAPLYTLGDGASAALTTLAQDGDASALLALYENSSGVQSAQVTTPPGGLVQPGQTIVIRLTVSEDFPYISIASKMMNTNDGFVAINGRKLKPGTSSGYNGLDAGTEENDELCANIPGPACPDSANGNPGNGEGYVFIHSGVRLGLAAPEGIVVAEQDWRNPAMIVSVSQA